MSERDATKYGSELQNHDWSAPEPEAESKPHAVIERHTLVILDVRPEERDIKYTFAIADDNTDLVENGTIFAVGKGHRLSGSNQFDPMGNAVWEEIPERVKVKASEALGMSLDERVDKEQVNEMVRGWGDSDE